MEMYSSTACKEALSAKTKVVPFHHQLHKKIERSSLSLNSILHLNMDSVGSGRNLTEDINVSKDYPCEVLASNLSVYIYIYIKVHKIFFTYGS
jgi:hypothetical protein